MASVGDLAALSSWIYNPTQSGLQSIDSGVWKIVGTSADSSFASNVIGFAAYTLVNQNTNEIVVVFRGTDPTVNLLSDALLTTKLPALLSPEAQAAIAYVNNQLRVYSTSTITLTGHSLGGFAAQVAMADLKSPRPSFLRMIARLRRSATFPGSSASARSRHFRASSRRPRRSSARGWRLCTSVLSGRARTSPLPEPRTRSGKRRSLALGILRRRRGMRARLTSSVVVVRVLQPDCAAIMGLLSSKGIELPSFQLIR